MTKQAKMVFLRSLLAAEEDEIRHSIHSCPEPSVLWSLTQKERGESAMVRELRAHVAECSSCADLTTRLQAFHGASAEEEAPVVAKAWAEAEPRLNKWIRRQLQSQASPKAAKSWSWNLTKWELPRMSWGLQFAALSCALAVVVTVLIFNRPGPGPLVNQQPQVASLPVSPGSEQRIPVIPSPDSSNLLTYEHKPTAPQSSNDADSITLSIGGTMNLLVTGIESQDEGTFKLEGKLISDAGIEGGAYTADVSGILSSPADGLTLSIRDVMLNNRTYLASAQIDGTPLTVAARLNSTAVPQPGETLQVDVSEGQVALRALP